MPERILVAFDDSPSARRALDLACDLALKYDAELQVLHVVRDMSGGLHPEWLKKFADLEHLDVRDALWSLGDEVARAGLQRAQGRGVAAVTGKVRIGEPAEEIRDHALETQADLIIMGRRGLGSVEALLLGSVSASVTQISPCSCVTVT